MDRRKFLLALTLTSVAAKFFRVGAAMAQSPGRTKYLPALARTACVANIIEAWAAQTPASRCGRSEDARRPFDCAGLLNEAREFETVVPQDEERLAAQIDSDFKQKRVCVIDGWLLSQTELSLCLNIATVQGAT